MPLHTELQTLVDRYGAAVLEDPEGLRAVLDDFLDEGAASTGDINLVVDAVRFGAYARLTSLLDHGAEPSAAVGESGAALARDRGGADLASAQWACAVLGFAIGRVSKEVVVEHHGGAETAPTAPPGPLPPPSPPRQPGDETVVPTGDGSRGWEALDTPWPSVPPGPVDPWNHRLQVWLPIAIIAATALLASGVIGYLLIRDHGFADAPSSGPTAANDRGPTQVPTDATTTTTTQPSDELTREPRLPPEPFSSPALYEFARHLFSAQECFIPLPGEYPVAETEPDLELVKCESQRAPFTATFWCKESAGALRADRRLYLSFAVPGTMKTISRRPYGQDAPADGVQVAFNRAGLDTGRVYWDSPSALCAGELQAERDNVEATIAYWLGGR